MLVRLRMDPAAHPHRTCVSVLVLPEQPFKERSSVSASAVVRCCAKRAHVARTRTRTHTLTHVLTRMYGPLKRDRLRALVDEVWANDPSNRPLVVAPDAGYVGS